MFNLMRSNDLREAKGKLNKDQLALALGAYGLLLTDFTVTCIEVRSPGDKSTVRFFPESPAWADFSHVLVSGKDLHTMPIVYDFISALIMLWRGGSVLDDVFEPHDSKLFIELTPDPEVTALTFGTQLQSSQGASYVTFTAPTGVLLYLLEKVLDAKPSEYLPVVPLHLPQLGEVQLFSYIWQDESTTVLEFHNDFEGDSTLADVLSFTFNLQQFITAIQILHTAYYRKGGGTIA